MAALACLLVWLALAAGLAGVPAHGADQQPSTGVASAETVGECLAEGLVWLHVQIDGGQVLRSECVGAPSSGLAALAAADVGVSESRGGYLCTLAGHPETCPAKYTGQYWQYWHAASVDAEWTYAQKGAGGRTPPAGSIEGWCYNAADEKYCHLPRLSPGDSALPRVDLEHDSGRRGMWLGVGALVALGLCVAVVSRRRRAGTASSH